MTEIEALEYELTPPAKLDFGNSFAESPLLWPGTWLINARVAYSPDPLAKFARATFRNSADAPVGPIWDIPVSSPVSLLEVNMFIELLTETKIKVLVDGTVIPEAEIKHLRLQP